MILIGFRLQVQDHEDKRKAKEAQLEAAGIKLEAAEAKIVRLERRLQEMGVQQE
jgi:hypothetical protein